jgi:CheY-like chemotaxis protein
MEADTDKKAQPKILLVDDNEPMRDMLKDVLEISQFRVSTAANVSEAIHLIDTEPFDVLLSDLHMPGAGDGFTVISAMRHKHPVIDHQKTYFLESRRYRTA